MHPKDIKIEAFSYELPDASIAKFPLENRDDSKLLVFKNGSIADKNFKDIVEELSDQELLVYNQTKVVHARLIFQKPTGGKIEVFCLEPDVRYADVTTAMLSTKEVYWKCLIGGIPKWKDNAVITIEDNGFVLSAERVILQDGAWIIRLFWSDEKMSFAEVLQKIGKVPLPPYLNREAITEDEENYQSIFAKEEGSVAAPTASLHFTPIILQSLQAKGVGMLSLTLHVGAGTFKPVKSPTMETHEMHAEWMEVSKSSIEDLILQLKDKKAVVAVGTTSCRTLESLYWIGLQLHYGKQFMDGEIAVSQWLPYSNEQVEIEPIVALKAIVDNLENKRSDKLITKTQIIIAPGYKFKIVNGLLTNFHQPQSTLLLLVSALIGEGWKSIYKHALENNYRFLSYGDSSLLWRTNTDQ